MFRIGSTILRNSSVPEREGGGGRNKEYSKFLLTHCGACKEWSKEEMVSGADANDVEFLLINGAEERVATPAATQHYQPLPQPCPS